MTSVEGTTVLVNERAVRSRKEWPTTKKKPSSEENLLSCKTVHWDNHLNWYHFFVTIETLSKFCILNIYPVFVLLLMFRS